MQRSRWPEAFDDRLQQAHLRQTIAAALHEQHRDPDIGKVLGAIARRLARRMQRKAEERQSIDAIERRARLRLRGHSAAEGFAARDQAQSGAASAGFSHRGAHGGLRDRRRVRPLAAFLHIEKLIAQRRHRALGQALGCRLHEGMGHPGAGTVGKDKTRVRVWGVDQQRGDGGRIPDRDVKLLRDDGVHPAGNPIGIELNFGDPGITRTRGLRFREPPP